MPLNSKPTTALALCAALLASACDTPPEVAPEYNVMVDLHYGEAYMDDDWGKLDDPDTGGITLDWGPNPMGLRLELGVWGTQDRFNETKNGIPPIGPNQEVGVDTEGRTIEVSVGARYVFDTNLNVYPYVGAGLAWVHAHLEVTPGSDEFDNLNDLEEDDSDTDIGYYGQVGLYTKLGKVFRAGLQYRLVTGTEFKEDILHVDGDYGRLTIFAGIGF